MKRDVTTIVGVALFTLAACVWLFGSCTHMDTTGEITGNRWIDIALGSLVCAGLFLGVPFAIAKCMDWSAKTEESIKE